MRRPQLLLAVVECDLFERVRRRVSGTRLISHKVMSVYHRKENNHSLRHITSTVKSCQQTNYI